MTHVGRFEVEGEIRILPHVVSRTRERDPEARGNDRDVAASIVTQVTAGIDSGMVYTKIPKDFRLVGDRGTGVTPWQRFITSKDRQKGWVIALDSPPDVVVVTYIPRPAPVRMPRR